MTKKLILIIAIIAAAAGLTLLIIKGTENKVDPLWNSLDTLFTTKTIHLLDEKADIVQYHFNSVQKDKSLYNQDVIKILSDPFLPSYEYRKFLGFFDYLAKNKRITVSGVSGSGKTTILDRVAKMLTASPDRILNLQCVEKMEVELHKEYVGYREGGKFYPGKLLLFLEKCAQDSLHNYVFVIDDIDKIYPATFFGAALWNEMDNASYKNGIDGYSDDISIPENFYLIAATHSGAGSSVQLNFEAYRRLGNNIPYFIAPDHVEFFTFIKQKLKFGDTLPPEQKFYIKRILYTFVKANEFIAKQYGESYMLGQWGSLRKYIEPKDSADFIHCFIENVNTTAPERPMSDADFDDIFYSIDHNGVEKHTNFFYYSFNGIIETGIFSELTVALGFALVTGLTSLLIYRRKRKFIRNLVVQTNTIVADFEQDKLTYNESRGKLLMMKDNIDSYLLEKKINFPEGNYLMTTIRQQLDKIKETSTFRSTSKELNEMFETYMSDGTLDEKEHDLLVKFLQSIKPTIESEVYEDLRDRIEVAYQKSVSNRKS